MLNVGTIVDTTIPPPNLVERRRMETSDVSEELQSFIKLTINEQQNKTKKELNLEIAKAVQIAFDQNIERFVRQIIAEASISPPESMDAYNLNVPHAKERVNNARPPRDFSQESHRQAPPAYEEPHQFRNRPNNRATAQSHQPNPIDRNIPSPESLNRPIRPVCCGYIWICFAIVYICICCIFIHLYLHRHLHLQ